ncbi:MAG TPA: FtsX-like permease family protein [Steroidobacteraceae bacterium]|nr:FtsX-like permease family protein [Steroidobacteraceae bacterium]
MFRHCLAAALRHLARNKLYTAISVIGLSVGLCTALLAALVVHAQLSHDHFIAGYDRIYMGVTVITPPGHATIYMGSTSSFVGAQLALRFSEIQAVTRLSYDTATLRHAKIEASERVLWADPNAFEVLPLPTIAGDLKMALSHPDTIVLTRSVARKYFGRDAPLGEAIVMKVPGSDGTHALSVAAVIEDLPPNATHLASGIFVSSLANWTGLHRQDATPGNVPGSNVGLGTNTYVKLAPHASARRLLQAMPAMAPALFARPPKGWAVALQLVRMDRIDANPWQNPGFSSRVLMTMIVGFGILLIACINFVNLLTARSSRRAREVGIRKLAGAGRRVLIVQFMVESMVYVLLSSLLAIALAEWSLPYANTFLDAGATFKYWRDPALLGAMAAAAVLLGMLAGAWPALALSAFRPLRILKGGPAQSRSASLLRQSLVTLQFAILVGLMIAAGVVYLQRHFATEDALRVDTDQMLLVRSPCNPAFVNQVQALPGVRGLACSTAGLLDDSQFMTANDRTGIPQLVFVAPVGPSLFDLYGVKPVAGKISSSPDGIYYVINETAARQLGFARPVDAIGFTLPAIGHGRTQNNNATLPVIGVVPDFSLGSVQRRIEAVGYVVTSADNDFNLLNIKLTGRRMPETLAAIDDAWKATGGRNPINRLFLEEHIQNLYIAMLREAQLFAVFTAVAVILACLGLLGLAASFAERRTREIGIRKALGADTGNVIHLLLRQFAKPVLWANLIAWPVTAYAMHRWLQGFAYHVELRLWLFPAAAALSLAIALLTVSFHAIMVARAKPIAALRYE